MTDVGGIGPIIGNVSRTIWSETVGPAQKHFDEAWAGLLNYVFLNLGQGFAHNARPRMPTDHLTPPRDVALKFPPHADDIMRSFFCPIETAATISASPTPASPISSGDPGPFAPPSGVAIKPRLFSWAASDDPVEALISEQRQRAMECGGGGDVRSCAKRTTAFHAM